MNISEMTIHATHSPSVLLDILHWRTITETALIAPAKMYSQTLIHAVVLNVKTANSAHAPRSRPHSFSVSMCLHL